MRQLDPWHVVLINTDVYDAVHGSLRTAGLPAVDERIPFPGSGQQQRFAAAFATAIQMVAWTAPDAG